MPNEEEALAYMRENNATGVYDQTLADYAAGKINVGIIRDTGPSIHLLHRENFLGRFDKLIEQAEAAVQQPVIFFTPRAQ